jgi:predicted PurR-regulated permease PerM
MSKDMRRASDPLVWVAVTAITLALLLVFQKALWLVAPALLALLLYYALYPLVQTLIFRGVEHDRAATAVMLAFLLLVGAAAALLAPQAAAHALDWQASAAGYLEGGIHLLDSALRALESAFPPLARAHLADSVARRLDQSVGIVEHLEPVVTGLAVGMPSLLLAPFLAYFFLRDGRRFKNLLCRAVPNAYFEKTLTLLHEVDRIARAYFQGLLKLTLLDTLTLAAGLWLMGFPAALGLGLICAVLAWIPYVGSILGGLLVVLVAATDFPGTPAMAYSAAALFVLVRLLDDFVYMPITIGRNLQMHPLVTVVMIFAGGAVAGIAGLMLVLPVLGVVRVVGETVGVVVNDARLTARHRHALTLRLRAAAKDLIPNPSRRRCQSRRASDAASAPSPLQQP